MENFYRTTPTLDNYWRSVILFGRNVASYKFALGKALIELSENSSEIVKLEELAVPFSKYLCEHLTKEDIQGTSGTSMFLDACRNYNSGNISQSTLVEETVKRGFNNVIDAFHVVGSDPIPIQFYKDERSSLGGIRLTDEIYKLREDEQFTNLPDEIEARWRLVETAWRLKLPTSTLIVEYDSSSENIITSDHKRTAITRCRETLNGYQKGYCFYCNRFMKFSEYEVDHFIPWNLSNHTNTFFHQSVNLDGIWNLVLACKQCNGPSGKWGDKIPYIESLKKLDARNEYLITSHHPLREALLKTGSNPSARRSFLNKVWNEASNLLHNEFVPEIKKKITL